MKILSFWFFIALLSVSCTLFTGEDEGMNFVRQSECEIPLISQVDVVVVGGTTSAVSAAVSAAENGAEVYLVAPKPYLGEDLCATLRLRIDESRVLTSEMEKRIFRDKRQVTPLEVKAALSQALIDANVKFVYGSFVTDVLWGQDNDPAGVVIANRAGRQAIKAKTIIDATDRAWVCRMAEAEVYPWAGQEIEFQRTVVMPGEDNETPNYVIRMLKIPMPDLHFSSFAQAEIIAREKTYTDDQLRAGESLFYIPPDPVVCKKNAADWNSNSEFSPGHFQVKGYENLFVLSGSADIPRPVAESFSAPAAMTGIAAEIGKAAAIQAKQKKISDEIFFKNPSRIRKANGDVREVLTGLRPTNNIQQTVTCPETAIPVSGDYDVVIVGGGTSGAAAAIAAGRRGMKVLVVEYLEGLGGTGTLGMIGKPYHGKKAGFAAEVPFPSGNIEPKMEWYRSEIVKTGGEIRLGVLGAGTYMDNNCVKGVVVCSPEGRSVVTAGVIIDATGNADIAIASGADYMYGDIERDDIALQGTGFSSRPLRGNYYNSDYLLVDETDMTDVWRSLVSVHITKASENIYDAVPMIQNRERRRVVGDHVLNYLDQIAGRTFPDAIVFSKSDYDSHGYPSSPYFALLPHDEVSRKENHPAPGGTCFTPYRCLLPKDMNGILVTGLGISMDRDASAMVRMQFDLANQGYAAGVAASLAVENGVYPRDIDVKELQKILVEKGNLPDSVLSMGDSFPLPEEIIKQAVKLYGEATNPQTAGNPLAIMLSHKDIAMPLVKDAFYKAEGNSKLLYALVLGMCGEKDGVPTLLKELEKFSGWDEKIFQGVMADYAHLPTPVDAVILALGYSGDKSARPALLKMVNELDQDVTLSHHRSLALALEKLADPAAALPLAELLQKPGMSGHAMTNIDDAFTELENNGKGEDSVGNTSLEKRSRALREIVLARALYRCGDHNGLGKSILESYQKDMRGLFARHAHQIPGLVFSCQKPKPDTSPPNILMICIDDLNDWLGCMNGHPNTKTPNIDRLANQGVLFNNAHCQAPLCGPSRASLMTGLRPSTTGIYGMIDDNRIRSDNPVTQDIIFLPEYLRNNGYYTMGIGKIFHEHAPDGVFDESGGRVQGFGPVPKERFVWSGNPGKEGYSRTGTDWGAFPAADSLMPDYKSALWTIERLHRNYDRPFFLTVGFLRPHVPWYVPQKWFNMHPLENIHTPPYLESDRDDLPAIVSEIDDLPMMPSTEWAMESGEWPKMVQAYLACISFVDFYVGEILNALEKSQYAKNTIIVLWSDHGYRLGEKGTFAKHCLWERATKAPLIFAGPGIEKGKVISTPAEMLAIYPTLLELCNLEPYAKNEGFNLAPALRGESSSARDYALTTYGWGNHGIRTGKYRYIRYRDGSEELYDHTTDPNEWHNLVPEGNVQNTIEELKKYLPQTDAPYAKNSVYNFNPYFTEDKLLHSE